MKTFIAISKIVRDKYRTTLPFISVMCKRPQREDVSMYIAKYLTKTKTS